MKETKMLVPIELLTSEKISSPEKIFILRIKLLMDDENVLYNSNKTNNSGGYYAKIKIRKN